MPFDKKKMMKNSKLTITKEGKVGGKINAFGMADRMGRQAKARAVNTKKKP